ncbi:PTS sugar transporter subunit IIA [Clostridium psychrophilum]|nr:PTS sugar transporter subunit IIA [Clostridium psychrophilum]
MNPILAKKNIVIGQKSCDKESAIKLAGQILVDNGYVEPAYIAGMMSREKLTNTYIGEGIAIPHGINECKNAIISSGISVVQFPNGIDYDSDEKVYLVVGIAGKDNSHISILANLAEFIIDNNDKLKQLFTTNDKEEIYNALITKL